MPIPTPNKGEPQRYFIARCMGNAVMKKDYADNKQRLAVCYGNWRKARGGKPPPPAKT